MSLLLSDKQALVAAFVLSVLTLCVCVVNFHLYEHSFGQLVAGCMMTALLFCFALLHFHAHEKLRSGCNFGLVCIFVVWLLMQLSCLVMDDMQTEHLSVVPVNAVFLILLCSVSAAFSPLCQLYRNKLRA